MNIKYLTVLCVTFLFLLSVVSAQKDSSSYSIAWCSDTDGGANPSSPGITEYGYSDSIGDRAGSAKSGDLCSDIHYTNALLYFGEDISWGDSILVENFCPPIGTSASSPGDLGWKTQKFYKCKCRNQGEGGAKGTENYVGFCSDEPEEVPVETVMAAEEKWQQSEKNELHPKLAKFLSFFGLWG